MEYAYYWVSTLLQIIIVIILVGIYKNTEKD